MEDEKPKSTVDFLNEISSEKPEIFKEEVATEEPVVEEEEEKPLPFHKDPKVQRYVERQIEKALEGVKPSAEREFREAVDDIKLPSSFVKLIGNDTPEKVEVLKDLSTYFGNLKGEARAEFLEEMQEQQNRATQEDKKAQDELDTYFEEIEETYDVDLSSNSASAKAMRSSFIDYVRKIAPKNEDGEVAAFPDLVSSFEEFQEKGKRVAPPTRAKELASRGMTRSGDANQAPKAGNSWKDVDRYFAKLKSENN
jgi:hypothetical protein